MGFVRPNDGIDYIVTNDGFTGIDAVLHGVGADVKNSRMIGAIRRETPVMI